MIEVIVMCVFFVDRSLQSLVVYLDLCYVVIWMKMLMSSLPFERGNPQRDMDKTSTLNYCLLLADPISEQSCDQFDSQGLHSVSLLKLHTRPDSNQPNVALHIRTKPLRPELS